MTQQAARNRQTLLWFSAFDVNGRQLRQLITLLWPLRSISGREPAFRMMRIHWWRVQFALRNDAGVARPATIDSVDRVSLDRLLRVIDCRPLADWLTALEDGCSEPAAEIVILRAWAGGYSRRRPPEPVAACLCRALLRWRLAADRDYRWRLLLLALIGSGRRWNRALTYYLLNRRWR